MNRIANELVGMAKSLIAGVEKKDITRQELARMLDGRRFRLRKVSFRGFGYGEAYTLSVEGLPGGNAIPKDVWEANKELFQTLNTIKTNYTFEGMPIIGA